MLYINLNGNYVRSYYTNFKIWMQTRRVLLSLLYFQYSCYLCIIAFAVSIEADPPRNDTNNDIDVIEYVLGSNLTMRCFVTPAPPPGSEFTWSCSTGCLDNVTVQETVNITELGLLKNVVINCSIFINNNQYFSGLVEINVTGKWTAQLFKIIRF